MNLDSTIERTLAYHQRTKHHLHQYARSPGYLDCDERSNGLPILRSARGCMKPIFDVPDKS